MWNILQEVLAKLPTYYFGKMAKTIKVRAFYFLNKHMVQIKDFHQIDIAHTVLGGKILASFPYRNLGNNHVYILAARADHSDIHNYKVYLLEQFGPVYRKVWESQMLWGWVSMSDYLVSQDCDRDGVREISYGSLSFGSGGGVASLFLFVPATTKLYELKVDFDWQNHLAPPMPEI